MVTESKVLHPPLLDTRKNNAVSLVALSMVWFRYAKYPASSLGLSPDRSFYIYLVCRKLRLKSALA